MVDGIQALGAVATDLSLVDIYAASFFKWMLSGFGVGVLVTSARARAAMEPAYQGYANMADPTQLQYAHVNIPAIYGLDATLDFFERVGWGAVFARVAALGRAPHRGRVAPRARSRHAAAHARGHLRLSLRRRRRREESTRAPPHQRVGARRRRARGAARVQHAEEVDQCLDALAELTVHP